MLRKKQKNILSWLKKEPRHLSATEPTYNERQTAIAQS